ncbi:hypothetical protein ACWGKQ_07645 [Streptomyces sp. NPDC054770]
MSDANARAVSAKYCSSAPWARPRVTPWPRPTNGPEYDLLVDTVAEACRGADPNPDPAALTGLFAHQDLTVPHHLVN